MRKKLLCLLLALLLLCSISVLASAEALAGDVTFTAAGRMEEENFNVDQVFSGLEPGDERSYTVYVHNRHPQTTRWYMSNEVLKSLEESAAAGKILGGAYSYKLTWNGPGGSQVIYDSTSDDQQHVNFVGGDEGFDNRVGLHEATSNLEDFFFLDTLNSGQNTAARIQMNFAVELKDAGGKTAVKTGDENNLTPYYIGMVVTGLLFLYLALDALTDRMYKKGRG